MTFRQRLDSNKFTCSRVKWGGGERGEQIPTKYDFQGFNVTADSRYYFGLCHICFSENSLEFQPRLDYTSIHSECCRGRSRILGNGVQIYKGGFVLLNLVNFTGFFLNQYYP